MQKDVNVLQYALNLEIMKDVAKHLSKFQKKEIDQLFNKAKASYKSKELVILTAPSLLSFGRILLITSRKVGDAPTRNLLRRRSKAIFYENKLFEHKKDCVIIFKKPASLLSFEALKTIIIKSIPR